MLIQDTCKFEEVPIKTEGATIRTAFSYYKYEMICCHSYHTSGKVCSETAAIAYSNNATCKM